MRQDPLIEIREYGTPIRLVRIDRALEVGRECDGITLTGEGVSRRHLKLLPSPLGLSVVDLGSRNGTLLNGVPLENRAILAPGDILRIGRTEILVVQVGDLQRTPAPVAAPDVSNVWPAPPPAPAVVIPPSRARVFASAVFKGTPTASGEPLFRTYMELPRRIPPRVWHTVRVGSVLCYLALCVGMFLRPAGALFAFFNVVVPLLPILFFVAPGLWRNICPLAAANQIPRVFRFSRARTPPAWLRRRGYVIAMTLFFGIAGARLLLFNNNAQATGILLSVTIVNAFAAGVTFKGKSGWCSSICPLLPLQRAYGQTPFVVVPNSHCQPCVACTKNCYDFKPQVAYQADLHDPDPQWSGPRKLFVSALPGFVLGFFTLVNHAGMTGLHVYERLGLFLAVSIGSLFAVEAVAGLSIALITALYAAAAINIFYWFAGVTLAHSVQTVFGPALPWLRWPISVAVALLSIVWISRTYWAERSYLQEVGPTRTLIPITPLAARTEALQVEAEQAQVQFLPDEKVVPATIGMSLLEVTEQAGLPIEAGCRMGVCGADPVAVLDGMDCLSEAEDEELTTLRRLGLAPTTRMACCARLKAGAVQVNLTPEPGTAGAGARPERFDRSITSVVVLGNGIAGVTAADFVRRGHPDCEVHLVGMESHVLYNRMGISRLVYGRSAMTGLFLLDEQWYADKGVTAWLNTIATDIDLRGRTVTLGTGERLVWDRLILTMGSSSVAPPIENFGAPGSFVLRSAEDAMDIRRYAQEHSSRQAVVAGGGLLGLEAAYALYELGLQVTVLERGKRLLAKQIDTRASELVQAHFDRLGIRVLYGAEARRLDGPSGTMATGPGAIEQVMLVDGTTIRCDVFLACVGIRSNADLARQAGIAVGRGVLVDDRMQTSVPGVFAAGDVAEHSGLVLGLWPIAAKQGEVAAANALGGDERLTAEIPATILKGVGLELSSIGRVVPEDGDQVIVAEDSRAGTYRRLIVSRSVVVGAMVLGHQPEELAAATTAVKKGFVVDQAAMAALRAGNWRVLKPGAAVVAGG